MRRRYRSPEQRENKRLYVGNVSSRTSESVLKDAFNEYGRIEQILLKDGFGFVEFEDIRDAQRAKRELDGEEVGGSRLNVQFSRKPGSKFASSPRRRRRSHSRGSRSRDRNHRREPFGKKTNYKMEVLNISEYTSWQDLKDFARGAGNSVEYTKVFDGPRGEKRGLIEYKEKEDFEEALRTLNGRELDGRKVKLIEKGSGNRYRSRSRDRSPRRSPRRRSRSKERRSRSRDSRKGGRSISFEKREESSDDRFDDRL